jgi:hypothetical protein
MFSTTTIAIHGIPIAKTSEQGIRFSVTVQAMTGNVRGERAGTATGRLAASRQLRATTRATTPSVAIGSGLALVPSP